MSELKICVELKFYIIMNRRTTPEEKKLLSSSATVARKWLFTRLAQGENLQELKQTCTTMSIAEKNLKQIWKRQMLKVMKKRRYQGQAGYLYVSLLASTVNIDKVIAKCKKAIAKQEDKDLKHMLGQLIHFKNKVKHFNLYAFEMLNEGKTPAAILDKAQELDKREEIDNENKLFVIQTLKHLLYLNERGIPPTLNLLKIALNAEYSYDPEILDDQAQVVMSTYQATEDTCEAIKIKKFCYEFIARTFTVAERADAVLIGFLFLGNWVSEETFRTLYQAYPCIHKNGMDALVYTPVKPLAEAIDKNKTLSQSEKYILSIAEMYKPKK